MEVLAERVEKSIKVGPLNPMPGTLSRSLPGFTVDVTLSEARLAQQVCTEITTMFMEQNIHLRQQQAEDTTQFLARQLEEAKTKLDEQDAKLASFQSRYMGALPEDEKSNLTLLSGMAPQLEAGTQGLNQARQEKAFAESLLNQQLAAWKSSSNGGNPQTPEQQLSEAQNQLVSLQRRYTDKHPSVLVLKHEIAQLQKQIQETTTQEQSARSDQKSRAPIVVEPPQIQQLRAQLHQLEMSITQKTQEQQQLQRQIRVFQGRMQSSPVIQQEIKALTRDYQTALGFYNDLLKKRNESHIGRRQHLGNREMYKKFFGLRENPFNVNPDPRYLFLTPGTQEALANLAYGIRGRKGIILMTGEVGTGKTTLLNMLLDWLHHNRATTAFIFNTRLSTTELFECLMADFGIPCESRRKSEVLIRLNRWLLAQYRAGQTSVLIVDEAQNLSPQVLAEIRFLTNLETSTEKLLQVVLSGQPELEEKLRLPQLRQLRQRITVRCRTRALSLEETRGYIVERLRIAAANSETS